MISTLCDWWVANAAGFFAGSLVCTAAGAAWIALTRSAVHKQRIAFTTFAAFFVWMVLAWVPAPRSAVGDGGGEVSIVWGAVEASHPAALVPPAEAESPLPIVSPEPVPQASSDGWLIGVGLVFAAGTTLSSVYLVLARILLARTLRRTRPAGLDVVRFARSLPLAPGTVRIALGGPGARPFVCCWMRPRIVLPSGLEDARRRAELRSVLLHEFAHLQQRDLRSRAVVSIAMPWLYWNPLYWWIRRRARCASELVADDIAARHDRKTSYVRSMIRLAESATEQRTPHAFVLGAMGEESEFYRRMTMLLNRKEPMAHRTSRVHGFARLAAIVGFAACAGSSWTASPLAAQDPSSQDTPVVRKTVKQVWRVVSIEYETDGDLGGALTAFARSGARIAGVEIAAPSKGRAGRADVTLVVDSSTTAALIARSLKGVGLISLRVVKVAPKPAPRPVEAQPKVSRKPRVSFAFENAEVADVVSAIAKISGMNIVISETLKGRVTVRLRNVPAMTALKAAVEQLEHTVKTVDGGIVIVAPSAKSRDAKRR